ncbi:MAG: alpha/beta fold hydrolase [Verrucomicrobiota bacterium]
MIWTDTTLVMLPGLHGTTQLYRTALTLDWGGMQTTALALPNHGAQDYAALASAITPTLPAGDLVLLAESFSTPLAMLLAAQEGPRIKAVVLVCGFCASPQSSGLGWLPLQPLFAMSPPAFLLRRYLTGEDAPDELLTDLASTLDHTPGATLAERARVVLALREADCPSLAQLPVLLLQARQDRIIPWDAQSQLERHLPEATCHWVDGPHLLMQTRTRECRDAVIKFLAGAAPA